jgi:hypothetical protein
MVVKPEEGTCSGRARRVVRHQHSDPFAKIKFKFHLLMANMILLHILIGN